MHSDVIKRYSAPVPRYTSYPTAPHFSSAISSADYASWLKALPDGANLSLYFHFPFCHTLCWYCGCNTKAARKYEPVLDYVKALRQEVETVARMLPQRHRVSHIHWGGGSPNTLEPAEILSIGSLIRERFTIAPDAEFAVEIDPRILRDDQVAAFAEAGINRVSVGVQDFDEQVQIAINRQQSFADTKRTIDMFRAHGVRSVNVDLVYGLPHQTRQSVAKTMRQVLDLSPDRIAIFGYAHLPSRLKHQRLIDEKALPGIVERFGQSRRLSRVLAAAGYKSIGLDHYAKPADTLAGDNIRRNFQGYTTDGADALIGFGASSIGQLPQGYVQNAVAAGIYQNMVAHGGLATARGLALSEDDRVRAAVIERLMCDFQFSKSQLRARFGAAAEPVIEEADTLVAADQDGLVAAHSDGFSVTDFGKPFVRSICACFDTYLGRGTAQHALAV